MAQPQPRINGGPDQWSQTRMEGAFTLTPNIRYLN